MQTNIYKIWIQVFFLPCDETINPKKKWCRHVVIVSLLEVCFVTPRFCVKSHQWINISKAIDFLGQFVYFGDKQHNIVIMYFSVQEALKRSAESNSAEVVGDYQYHNIIFLFFMTNLFNDRPLSLHVCHCLLKNVKSSLVHSPKYWPPNADFLKTFFTHISMIHPYLILQDCSYKT